MAVTSTYQRGPAYRYIRDSDKLPTPESLYDLPASKITCKVKLFNPTGSGTWWIAAYDPESGVAFGVAEIHEREGGDFWLPELVEYRGKFGLPIERDLYYTPKTMKELMAKDG